MEPDPPINWQEPMSTASTPASADDFTAALETLMSPPDGAAPGPSSEVSGGSQGDATCERFGGSLGQSDSGGSAFGCAPAETESDIADAPPPAAEKRSSLRHPYLQHVQVLSLAEGSRTPTAQQFREVLCEDLSTGGAAVFLKDAPESETFIIGLGQPPNRTYLLARVTHVEPVFRIGCQFLRRLHVDPATGESIELPSDNSVEAMPVTSKEDGAR